MVWRRPRIYVFTGLAVFALLLFRLALNGRGPTNPKGRQSSMEYSARNEARPLSTLRPFENNDTERSAVQPNSIGSSVQLVNDGRTDPEKRQLVRDMMRHAWQGYANYSWGHNELRPISRRPHTGGVFGGQLMGASIVDGIDTLFIMGLRDEYQAARSWIEQNLDFNKYKIESLSVFETNIRFVGGLLSIYALSKDEMFLDKAKLVADHLLPAFDTPSGIPLPEINLSSHRGLKHERAHGGAILSEFASFHLEFIYLSHATGDPKYRDAVMKLRDTINRAAARPDGLYNNFINIDTGQWMTKWTHVSMGALGDTFYEYLIKSYVQSDGRDQEAYRMYLEAIRAQEGKLIFKSTRKGLTYLAKLEGTSIVHRMDSLACYAAGMLALGASKSSQDHSIKTSHMTLAEAIANTCHESSASTKSHLAPETFVFTNQVDSFAYGPREKFYILRPEIVESYFYLWRYTHDPKYRAWAWDFVEALERHCKSEAGYSGVRNVYEPAVKDDVQQTFFLAEVLKYLYLIFSHDNEIDLDYWVFNTEAHPLPILR